MKTFSSFFVTLAFSPLPVGAGGCSCAGNDGSPSDADADTDTDTGPDADTDSDTGEIVDAGGDAGDAATDAGIPPGYDCGGSDVLEVRMVEIARFDPATDLPIEGATLVVDCEGGRIEATTNADGIARAYRLDLVGDPADVTLYKAGYTTRTLYDVGGDRTVPKTLRVPLATRANVPFTRLDGDLGRSADPSGVLVSVRGGGYIATAEDPFYQVALADDYPGVARLTGIEWAIGGGGTGTLISFVEDVLDPKAASAPTLDFPAVYDNVERFDVTVTYDVLAGSPLENRLALDDDDPDPTRAYYGAIVTDQEDSTNARNILGLTESSTVVGTDETFHVAYADEMEGSPILIVIAASDDRKVYSTLRSNVVPPDPERLFVVEDPPDADVDPDVVNEYPETTVILSGARWANIRSVSFVAVGSEQAYGGTAAFWTLTVPTDRIGWRLPDPPTGVAWPALLPAFGNFAIVVTGTEYAEDPLQNYALFDDRDFGRNHFLRSSADGRYLGRLVE